MKSQGQILISTPATDVGQMTQLLYAIQATKPKKGGFVGCPSLPRAHGHCLSLSRDILHQPGPEVKVNNIVGKILHFSM